MINQLRTVNLFTLSRTRPKVQVLQEIVPLVHLKEKQEEMRGEREREESQ